jgi:HlyD family secretion protein
MKNKALFREVAVNRLSSPEELDNLLQVTSARGWIALAGIGLLIATAVVWAIGGSIPTKLVGQQCILVRNGGVKLLTSAASGKLSDLAVEAGDRVTRGQIIGRLEQYDQLEKVNAGEARMKEAQRQYDEAVALAAKGDALRAVTLAQQAQNLDHQLAAATQRARLLKDRIETQASLFEQGLITKQTLIASQLELASVQLESETMHSQVKQLDVTRLEAKKQSETELTQLKNGLEEAKRNVALLLRDTKSFAAVVSPYTGKVVEVKAAEGQLVERGTHLVSVEPTGVDVNEMEAYVYLPASEGKKVATGMRVEVSPSTARREEFGFMPSFVASVADYPSTDQGLMRVFGNDKLVQQLSGTLAPIQIVAALKSSATNPSRYEWSTRSGPPFTLQSGTACSASITLAEQRPIELVIPVLRKFVGAD